MLVELHVRDLGVIADLHLVLGPGMTALTGETGAGKTLVVEAIELLLGGRADPVLVRPGADEALVEGRFVAAGGEERVLARAVPAGGGRSRAYLDGRMAPVGALGDVGAGLVDLHGQHAHQSLLHPGEQRAALDAFAGIDTGGHDHARREVAALDAALSELGGDERARAREIDLLRFQLGELEAAGVSDAGEDDRLRVEEEALAEATAHREAAVAAAEAVRADGGAVDALGAALAAVRGRAPLAELESRLRGLQAEAVEAATDLRAEAERLTDDPERLAAVRQRRQQLADLRRKYGDTLSEVLDYRQQAAARLAELEGFEARAIELEQQRTAAQGRVAAEARALGAARRQAAPRLAAAVEARLRELAMPRARLEVEVGADDPGDRVSFLLAANPGEPALPLAKVASGGELARAMLACRLVLTTSPPTLVFDEVDAGIGGEAAVAVGRALARVAEHAQVLVVTHLPQVAAFAHRQVAVTKDEVDGRTLSRLAVLDDAARVVELSRMLSGQPGSDRARDHAEELLALAAAERRG